MAAVIVSRETNELLSVYATLLRRWQTKINLVSSSTLENLWVRHIEDSLQLIEFAESKNRWLDLGTGAGFPGMVVAIQLRKTPEATVHLIESDAKKCAFLKEVARETQAPVIIHRARIENIVASIAADVVTARALAPLPKLIEFAAPLMERGAIGLFPKGRNLDSELKMAKLSTGYSFELKPNKIDPEGKIVLIRSRVTAKNGAPIE